ncbi:Positive regulator of purine utilization [Colletotrichum sidae]|uniref:Positive regulator of purine utilization n=1 Tax=Colletotrichum sidae TaxID=1347389 RepID=A0A4V3I3T6_9PEZI|nr:Positive regulator of purine utilization [Colletotrichum sidae]
MLYGEHQHSQPAASLHMFRAYTVFAIAVLLLNRTDSSFPVSRADNYFDTATNLLSQKSATLCTGDTEHLCNLLLVAQYCCFASNLSGAWHFLGLASRLAIELSLHDERAIIARNGQGELNQRRWLFWALYTMERNLCVIVGRPFAIPDEAIHTPLPELSEGDTDRAAALHLIKHRILESEIYATLNQKPPANGACLDFFAWRESMRRRVIEWLNSAPAPSTPSTQLAPSDIFDAILHGQLVLLYYPSASFPNPSENDVLILAQSASECISNYRRTFRDGQLRFFWRTTHNLFRSGVAMAYCVHLNSVHRYRGLNQADMVASINTCMSILGAMVERYPSGSVYRDAFENLSSSVLKSAGNAAADGLGDLQRQQVSAFSFEPSLLADMALRQTSLDALYWGFGDLQRA